MDAPAKRAAASSHPDEWGRARIWAPAGTSQLHVRYSPPWWRGLLAGAAVALLALLAGFNLSYFAIFRERPRPVSPAS